MDHTSEGIVECQGQNPCGIIAGLTEQVGGAQISISKVMKMLIKCCLISVSILQGIEVKYCTYSWHVHANHLMTKLYPI